jgi:hypothetical protein
MSGGENGLSMPHSRVNGTGFRSGERHTLNLYTPNDVLSILAAKVLVVQSVALLVCKVFDIRKNLPLKGIRHNGVWHVRVGLDGHECV